MHITGDLSLTDFGTLVDDAGYPKLADYLHTAYPGTKFITVGEKSYAVESATASHGDIAVRLSSRRTDVTSDYPTGCREPERRWRWNQRTDRVSPTARTSRRTSRRLARASGALRPLLYQLRQQQRLRHEDRASRH